MPSVNLTDTFIKSLKPRARDYEVFDQNVPGHSIRTWPTGKKTFSYIYRMHGKKTRRSLGAYPSISLTDSRSKARTLRSRVGMGIDPQVERDQQSRDARTATFAEVGENYIDKEAKQKNKSWRQSKRILDRQLNPLLGKQPMPTIDQRMIHSVLDKILRNNGKSSANHAFSEIRRICNWSVERGIISESPCR